MMGSLQTYRSDADPRILKVQVERAANALSASIVASPVWACTAVFVCQFFPRLGTVPFSRAASILLMIGVTVFAIHYALNEFNRERLAGTDPQADSSWLGRLLFLNVLSSTGWALVTWMLMSEGNLLNHIFIERICLAATA